MNARPLVLLTDYGASDFYAGVTRAILAASSPASRILDLDHDIPAHDIAAASFVLARAFEYLPADAVIVVVVDPGVGTERRGLIASIGARVLVGPDNGFMSDLLCARGAAADASFFTIDDDKAARMSATGTPRGATFHGRDIFAPVGAAIARGAAPSSLGAPANGVVLLRDVPGVSVDGGCVRGTGRYVDHFGNVLSDIPVTVVERALGDLAGVTVSVGETDAGPLRTVYAGQPPGRLMALVNSWGLVEAAVNGGRAIDLLGGAPPRAIRFELRAH